MDIEAVSDYVKELLESPENAVSPEAAISPDLAGMRMFDLVMAGAASADDELFAKFRTPGIAGPMFMPPREWMPEASSVISIFFKFTDGIVRSMENSSYWPSPEWLHGRIEGQAFISWAVGMLAEKLKSMGHAALAPASDGRFSVSRSDGGTGKTRGASYSSSWSERHAAFACGLGTFGLSRGIITRIGTPGRFGSVVTSLELAPEKREYSAAYEYCSMCAVCAKNCPAGAITLENGKDNSICSGFLDLTKERFAPRYGCGRCQIGVPCMAGPAAKR
ncbi:MAG: hypothetical protein LBR87_02310 [Synergistaceae bacterium]|nr:hypothetical protein [Synergistaceae bacterium]